MKTKQPDRRISLESLRNKIAQKKAMSPQIQMQVFSPHAQTQVLGQRGGGFNSTQNGLRESSFIQGWSFREFLLTL